jgi:phosphatidylserine synthase
VQKGTDLGVFICTILCASVAATFCVFNILNRDSTQQNIINQGCALPVALLFVSLCMLCVAHGRCNKNSNTLTKGEFVILIPLVDLLQQKVQSTKVDVANVQQGMSKSSSAPDLSN